MVLYNINTYVITMIVVPVIKMFEIFIYFLNVNADHNHGAKIRLPTVESTSILESCHCNSLSSIVTL
jgi:hypothetical protein